MVQSRERTFLCEVVSVGEFPKAAYPALELQAQALGRLYSHTNGKVNRNVTWRAQFCANMYRQELRKGDIVQNGSNREPVRFDDNIFRVIQYQPWIVFTIRQGNQIITHAYEMNFLIAHDIRTFAVSQGRPLQSVGPFDVGQIPQMILGGH